MSPLIRDSFANWSTGKTRSLTRCHDLFHLTLTPVFAQIKKRAAGYGLSVIEMRLEVFGGGAP